MKKLKGALIGFLIFAVLSLVLLAALKTEAVQETVYSADNAKESEEHVRNKVDKNLIETGTEIPVIVKAKDKAAVKARLGKLHDMKDEKLLSGRVSSSELEALLADPDVIEVWPDRITEGFLDSSASLVHAPSAWNLGVNGTGVKIAILDTGIAQHTMLQNVVLSADFTGTGATDLYGHGTHVAGIAAGHDDTYTGIAPGAVLYNGKVLDDSGHGYLSWLINGIDWAMDPDNDPATDDGADIISLSLGATYSGEPEDLLNSPEVEKVREAVSRGIVVVIASGNCGSGCSGFYGVTTPGITPEAITVGAVDDNNEWAAFSSGDTVSGVVKPDVAAPGVSICSSVPDGYDCWSGTSMATPHITGAAAILLSDDASLSPAQVKDVLKRTALDLGDAGEDTKYGSGLIDIEKVLNETHYTSGLPVIRNVAVRKGLVGESALISADCFDADSCVLELDGDLVCTGNDSISYEFVPDDVRSYSFEITAVNEFGTRNYASGFDIKNYKIDMPVLMLNNEAQIAVYYRNNGDKKEKVDIGFSVAELDSVLTETTTLKINENTTETAVFEFTPHLLGAYNLDFVIGDEPIRIQAVSHGHPLVMMEPVKVWVRG